MAKEHPQSEVLAAFGRGELPSVERVAVAEHLSACDTCSAFLGQIRTLNGLSPSQLQQTNPAAGISDGHFAPPGSVFGTQLPAALADHPQYRILDRLGEGGMGVVYKAEHRVMDRTVALKVLAPHLTANAAAVDRFRQEVRAAARLLHPNIVVSHDAGEAGGQHFLVMEYVEGISLDRLVSRRGPLAVTMACHFARQVAIGLQHAADKGMVHRDIKPQNLIVTRKGQVKILDFGLARLHREIEPGAVAGKPLPGGTSPNFIMGTPDYLSPEQAKNSSAVDIRSDLYALGCTLYFLLTGKTPFNRASTLIDKLLAHTEEEPPPLSTYRQDVPDGLVQVIAKLMAKKPSDRFATPAEAAAALAPFTKPADAPAAAPAPTFEIVEAEIVRPAAPVVAESLPTVKARKASRKKAKQLREKRRKLILTGIGMIVLGLLVGGGVKLVRKLRAADSGKETASNISPPTGETPPALAPAVKKQPRVLMVLPSHGLWLDDYRPVRQRLETLGAKVQTASGPSQRAVPDREEPANAIPVDVVLRPEMDVSEYDAIVFVGRFTPEFASGKGGYAAATVLDKFRKKNGAIAAICEGEGVLAVHGFLNGKAAAASSSIRQSASIRSLPIKWSDKSVEVDGRVVTASAPEHAVAFADALLKVLKE